MYKVCLLIIEPIFQSGCIGKITALYPCNTDGATKVNDHQMNPNSINQPFAFAINFMFREGDVLVTDSDTEVLRNQAQILVGRPLKEEQRVIQSQNIVHIDKTKDKRTHCRSPIYRAS
jgi:hypothetical protein